MLSGDLHAIISTAALSKVIGLEVKRRLGKSIAIRKGMQGIDQIKGVNAGSIDVIGDGWRLRIRTNFEKGQSNHKRGWVEG